jgi:hypothetical protein
MVPATFNLARSCGVFKYSSNVFDSVLIAKSVRTEGKKWKRFIKKKLTI